MTSLLTSLNFGVIIQALASLPSTFLLWATSLTILSLLFGVEVAPCGVMQGQFYSQLLRAIGVGSLPFPPQFDFGPNECCLAAPSYAGPTLLLRILCAGVVVLLPVLQFASTLLCWLQGAPLMIVDQLGLSLCTIVISSPEFGLQCLLLLR